MIFEAGVGRCTEGREAAAGLTLALERKYGYHYMLLDFLSFEGKIGDEMEKAADVA